MIAHNYNDQPMTGLTESDYWTLEHHLKEQVMAIYCTDMDDPDARERDAKHVGDVLNNSWSDDITAREWLARAGKELGIDTTDCVGA